MKWIFTFILFLTIHESLFAQKQLIAHHPFDGNGFDISGNNKHASIFGCTITNNRCGNSNMAYYFNGLNNYILLAEDYDLPERTFAFWFYANSIASTGINGMLGTDHANSQYGRVAIQVRDTNKIQIYTGNQQFTATVSAQTWYHVAYVQDLNVTKLYLNAVLIGTIPTSTFHSVDGSNKTPIGINRKVNSGHFHGKMDDLRIYNYPLSETEIQSLIKPCFEYKHVCVGDSTRFTINDLSGIDSVSWSFGDSISTPNASTLFEPKHVFSDTGTYTVSLRVYHQNGSDLIRESVSIQPYPVADFLINDSIQCYYDHDFYFTDNSSIATGNYAPTWYPGDSTMKYQSNIHHKYSSPGSYQVKLLVVSSYACKDSVSKTVKLLPPKAAFIASDTGLCFANNLFTFFNTSPDSITAIQFQWLMGNNDTFLNTDTLQYTYNNPGIYDLKLIAYASNNCSDTFSKTIEVFPMPEAVFVVNDSDQCLYGNSFYFTNSSVISKGNLSSAWFFGDGNISTQMHPVYSYAIADTYKVNLVATSDRACKDSMERKLVVFPHPQAHFVVLKDKKCEGDSVFYFQDQSGAFTGGLQRNWYFGDGNIDTASSVSHAYAYPGIYTVELILTSVYGCQDTHSAPVYLFPRPVSDFSINKKEQCLNGNLFSFSDQSTLGFGSYSCFWDFGHGIQSRETDTAFSYTLPDTLDVFLLCISDQNCRDSISKTVIIHPSPISLFNVMDSAQCLFSNSFVFTNLSSVSHGSLKYQWYFGDFISSNDTNPNHSYHASGNYQVRLSVKSDLNCMDSFSRNVIVHPVPFADYRVNDSDQCFRDHLFVFSNNSSISSGFLTYAWFFGDGTVSNQVHPMHDYILDGSYLVKLLVRSSENCTDSIEMKVYVYPDPEADFQVVQPCTGDSTFFINQSVSKDTMLFYRWDLGDGNISTRRNPAHLYSNSDMYTVTLQVFTSHMCSDSIIKGISGTPLPFITLIGDSIFDPVYFNPFKVKGFFDSVYWSNGDTGYSTLIKSPGLYWVEVVGYNTCRNSQIFRVVSPGKDECLELLQMNLISPNQDGINDRWIITPLIKVKPVRVSIFNRWGDRLYYDPNYADSWEGTKDGKQLPDGTYYFIVKTGDNKTCKGAVNILR